MYSLFKTILEPLEKFGYVHYNDIKLSKRDGKYFIKKGNKQEKEVGYNEMISRFLYYMKGENND